MNISVPTRLGAEAHLLSRGVSLDTVGRGAGGLPRPALHGVAERWPREALAGQLDAVTRKQAQMRPESRAALLHRLGFSGLLHANPLEG